MCIGVLAAFIAAALRNVNELREEIDNLNERIHALEMYYEEVEEIKERLKDAPIEKFDELAKQEEAYYQGLQNIFNYGGVIPRLNLGALEHE